MAVLFSHRYLLILDTGDVCFVDELTDGILNLWDCTIIDLVSEAYYDSSQQHWSVMRDFNAYISALLAKE